jgi:hypothetical protein
MHDDDTRDELYDEIERRALFDMPEEEAEEVDLVARLQGEEGTPESADITLGGYIAKHGRVPAFDGIDGQPYTVDLDVERTEDEERPFAAFLVFIRWAATGAGIMDHCESGDVARAATEEEARSTALELTLYDVKAELDRAIEHHRRALEE